MHMHPTIPWILNWCHTRWLCPATTTSPLAPRERESQSKSRIDKCARCVLRITPWGNIQQVARSLSLSSHSCGWPILALSCRIQFDGRVWGDASRTATRVSLSARDLREDNVCIMAPCASRPGFTEPPPPPSTPRQCYSIRHCTVELLVQHYTSVPVQLSLAHTHTHSPWG